jgi:UDP-N-acetylglucosamine:LPS N-acetylglucosamine transferase
MGGIPERYLFLEQLTHQSDIYFIIPGGSQTMKLVDNIVLLPHHSEYFHPDLINTCDAVIGKLGYSTLAEVYHAGVPYGYIPRTTFKESEILEAFVKNKMQGCAISESQYKEGSWVSFLPEILALARTKRNGPNGATEAAQFICNVLNIKP